MAPENVMHRATHPSAIAIISDHIEAWRRVQRWSRETLADEIVQAHERIGAVDFTGVKFEPKTTDTFERMRVNADRVFRWLDDHSKSTNLLSVNLLWSVLAALPPDRRVQLLNDLLRPVGVSVRSIEDGGAEPSVQEIVLHFRDVVDHGAQATVAVSQLLDGVDPGEVEHAEAKLGLMAATIQRTRGLLSGFRRK